MQRATGGDRHTGQERPLSQGEVIIIQFKIIYILREHYVCRKTLRSLLTVDVHSRDILQKLIKDRVTSVAEFSWTSQMR